MDYRALSQMELPTQPFPMVQHEFRIFIEEKAFDRICKSADPIREVGGILVGEVLRDESGAFVRVDDVIEALHAEESGTELTFTHATWNHIHQQMDTVYAGKKIIGWYHTHPNFGIFLSERDQFIQQSFFDLAFQIALVYDPVRREHGIFSWRETKPWRVRQYWVGTHEHVWDGERNTPDGPSPKPQKQLTRESNEAPARAANNATLAPQALSDLVGNTWIMGAVLVGILLGLMLGITWGKRNAAPEAAPPQTAQEAVASLDSDLLAVIRGSLSDDVFAKTFDEGIARLDRAAEALKSVSSTDPAMKSALQSVIEAQQSLSRVREDRHVAREMLQQLELVIRQTRVPELFARDLAVQRAALGEVYLELARAAATNKDGPRVSELLTKAAIVDPDHQATYAQHLKRFEQEGIVSQPTGSSNNNQGQPAAPSASAAPSSSPVSATRR